MNSIYFLLSIMLLYTIELIIEIRILNRFRKRHILQDYFKHLFVGITITVCNVFAFIPLSGMSPKPHSAILCIILLVYTFGGNIIILLFGRRAFDKGEKKIFSKEREEERRINKKPIVKSVIIVVLTTLLISFVIPTIVEQIKLKDGKEYVVNYLETKYGNGNYKITKIYKKHLHNNGYGGQLDAYHFEVKCDFIKSPFIINVDDDFLYISDDFFLPIYYSEKNNFSYELRYDSLQKTLFYNFYDFNKYLKENLNHNVDFSSNELYEDYVIQSNGFNNFEYSPNYYIIPNNYGKIPNINELCKLIKDYNHK